MIKLLNTLSFLLLFALMMPAQDQVPNDKSEKSADIAVEEIIAHYLENIGGEEAWTEVESMTFAGTTQQGGMSFPTTVYSMRPARNKIVADAMGKQFIDCTDGDEGWFFNPFMGMEKPQKKSAEQMEMSDEEFENPFIHYKEKGSEVELMGVEEVDGTPTYKVRLKKVNGKEYFYFFDTEYFVPVMMKVFISSGENEGQSIEIYFSDYEEVGELVIPHSIEQRLNGVSFLQMTADTIILNDPTITAELFAFPEDKE